MKIGVPKEIKNHEYRVGMGPAAVGELTKRGHEVFVETAAGQGSSFSNQAYEAVGATILPSAAAVFEVAELLVKVKEPQPEECALLQQGQTLFTYLHLAPDKPQAKALIKSKATCIAYETVTSSDNSLPLLIPMSEVAGRMSTQVAAHCLERAKGGRGILMGGVSGTAPAKVLVLGGGTVGVQAAKVAVGMGAAVVILDRAPRVLRGLAALFNGRAVPLYADHQNLVQSVKEADVVIGGVLVPGATAPKLVTAEMVKAMKPGSVLVDVSIDQGGCFETSSPTTHAAPTYLVDGVVHYCVTNMPGAVPRTSTLALNNSTLPYIIQLAHRGAKKALLADPYFLPGLNVHNGHLTNEAVGAATGLPSINPAAALNEAC